MIRVKKGNDKIKVSAVFNSISDKVFPLQFSEVATIADEKTKTYEVVFTMTAPQGHTILPGMTAVVSAQMNELDAAEPSFHLPANVVLKDNANHYVYVVIKAGEGKGKISKRVVTIGDITASGIEIYSGLAQGDNVITAGMTKISDGMLVKF
jgi:multidrug efflux pump subunit AcrA (membrane-fusion protein)